MLRDHPIFGVGPDQFLNQFQTTLYCSRIATRGIYCPPHNIILDYWLTLGIIGVLILLWLLWRYFREAFNRIRQSSIAGSYDSVGRALALGLIASMLDFLVHGMVDNSYFLMDLALIFWMCCGLLQLSRQQSAFSDQQVAVKVES